MPLLQDPSLFDDDDDDDDEDEDDEGDDEDENSTLERPKARSKHLHLLGFSTQTLHVCHITYMPTLGWFGGPR